MLINKDLFFQSLNFFKVRVAFCPVIDAGDVRLAAVGMPLQ